MDKIGIGVIGGGGIAAEGHIRGYQEDPRAEVVALYDVNEAKMREQAHRLRVRETYTALDAFLERKDIQAVSVCSPDHLHAAHVQAALQAGKHVLCEKPMCTTWDDAAHLVREVRRTGQIFLGGHVYHFRPDYRAMVDAYRRGEIGEVWLAEGDYISDMRPFYGPHSQTPWRTDAHAPQDILLGGGCHPLGLMLWAMQTRVKRVFAFANHKAEPMLPLNDCHVVSMEFENGAIGKLIAASGNRGYAPVGGHLVLYGAKGTLWGGRLYRNNPELHRSEVVKDWKEQFKAHKPRVHDTRQVHHWAEQCEHFLDCILGKAEPLTSVEQAAYVVAALTAALESEATGQAVTVCNDFI
ncbi:MAG TPA: Gfo/Idh/MocA family oxidoreductase [Caldilineaceae bacterium]|nr:Gfo/Idh/MocA family oxidoreductase [Caldilineaceae bacterium]